MKKGRRLLIPALCLLFLLVFTACRAPETGGDKIGVVVSILPQMEFVASVGGELVKVAAMVPPGAEPHTYEPTPSQIENLARARMYAKVGSGVEFELAWMDKLMAVNQEMLVVDCSQGVPLRQAAQGLADPHIWLSPRNAQIMVRNIADGLVRLDPAHRTDYEKGRDAYLEQLTLLDKEIGQGLANLTNRTLLTDHDLFGYFAQDYHLNVITIGEEGKEPSAADLARLIQEAKGQKIKVVFTSPEFNPRSAQVIAREIGARVAQIDPLAQDYLANMRRILRELVQAGG